MNSALAVDSTVSSAHATNLDTDAAMEEPSYHHYYYDDDCYAGVWQWVWVWRISAVPVIGGPSPKKPYSSDSKHPYSCLLACEEEEEEERLQAVGNQPFIHSFILSMHTCHSPRPGMHFIHVLACEEEEEDRAHAVWIHSFILPVHACLSKARDAQSWAWPCKSSCFGNRHPNNQACWCILGQTV